MSRLPKHASIPLLCSLCPKSPHFSDISHLLTHISSKGHLSCRFKLQIRCQSELEARRQLEVFDTWYADNGLEELLAERLATKEQKSTVNRTRNLPASLARESHREQRKSETKVETLPIDQLISTPPIYRAPVPRMHIWSTAPPLVDTPSDSVHSTRWDRSDIYTTPTMKRSVPNFTHEESPDVQALCRISPPVVKRNGTRDDTENDSNKLKGVYWPGMNLFDSATAEMKRMRNQRKDGSVLAQMKTTSRVVEPNEIIYNTQGEFQRMRDIYDSSVESSPVQSEKAPSPKKRRARKSKSSIETLNPKISEALNLVKGGRPKLSATKRKAAQVTVGVSMHQRAPKQNILGDISSNIFSTSKDDDEEFRLTVEDMGKKRQLSIFRDTVEDSPGRTESPLEDHRFDFPHGLPLDDSSSNMIVRTSPSAIQIPRAMRFGGKENIQPDYLNRRNAASENSYPPQVFHNHTANPLVYHPYAYAFGFSESPTFHGDFKPLQSNIAGDFKPILVPGAFKKSSSSGHQNEFVNSGFSFTM